MGFLKRNWFLLGLLAALAAGLSLSGWGQRLNPQNRSLNLIIVWLFFSSGLAMPSESLLKGFRDITLHIYIQSFIFLIMPFYAFLTMILLREAFPEPLRAGILALSCLPTTVSSCVILTQRTRGNVAGSLFNAMLANTAGVFLSPLILSFLLSGAGQGLPQAEIIRIMKNLLLMLPLPLLAGQALRWIGGPRIYPLGRALSWTNSLGILLIVFFAFAASASSPAFRGNLSFLGPSLIYLLITHPLLLLLSYLGARMLRFSPENVRTVLFTAPQKTLAMGVVLLSAFFASDPGRLGAALIPSLIYHPLQLLTAGIVSGLLKRAPTA